VNPPWDSSPQVHGPQGVERMRASGGLAADVLEMACAMAAPGVTTESIDAAVHEMVVGAGAYPSPLNYGRFPKSVCTSVNECICHGIPDSRELRGGDILNIDVTVFLDGHHGDTSRMVGVGEVLPEAQRLMDATKASLEAAIAICGPGVPFQKLGGEIQKVADSAGFGVVKDFVGHGVGTVFHCSPTVLHYRNMDFMQGKMQVGQTFTIEPMLTEGSTRPRFWPDEWTAVTADGGLSAQYEHTLLITEGGAEILTQQK